MTPTPIAGAPLLFEVAVENPTRFAGDCAWFLQNDFRPLDGLDVGATEPWHAWGERVRQDTTLPTLQGGSRILRAGGAVLKKADQSVVAIQPFLFMNRFSRCFSSGTEIVRLSENPTAQAEALAQANTQLRSRHAELLGVSFWKAIRDRKPIAMQKANLHRWDQEIEQHIRELKRHTLSDKHIRRG